MYILLFYDRNNNVLLLFIKLIAFTLFNVDPLSTSSLFPVLFYKEHLSPQMCPIVLHIFS